MRAATMSAIMLLFGLAGCGDRSSGPTEPTPGGPPGPIASVVVTPADDTVLVGEAVQLAAAARTAAGDTVRGAALAWQSLDPTVASVSTTGLVTGISAGTARVRVSAGNRSAEAAIRVESATLAPRIVRVSPTVAFAGGPELALTIVGADFRPNVRLRWNGISRPTTYLSDTLAVATIWAGDLAEVGEAVIDLVNPGPGGGGSAAARYPIVPQTDPVASITLEPEVAMSVVGAAVPVRATVRNAAGAVLENRLVTWRSGHQLVATVNGHGVVAPVGVGEVTITAESEGKTATFALSVATEISHLLLDDGAALSVLDMRLGRNPVPFWVPASGIRWVDPSPSPDGRRIGYTIDMGGKPSIAVLDQGTRTYQFLTADAGSDQPAWSPAGGRIAFRSVRAGRPDVWVMNEDGTGAVNLTATMPAGFEAGWPAWSPDGTRLVFSAGLPASVSLYTIGADGAGLRPLLISPEHDSEPAWRGDAVVFTRRAADGSTDLHRIAVGGGPLIRLTTSGAARSAAWSPDGRWIAFVDGPAIGGRHDLKVVRPFGDETRTLSRVAAGGGGRHPSWLTHR